MHWFLIFCILASTGGGFASKNKFLYGKATADLKLVPGDSAGVVTAFYVSECRPCFALPPLLAAEPYIAVFSFSFVRLSELTHPFCVPTLGTCIVHC